MIKTSSLFTVFHLTLLLSFSQATTAEDNNYRLPAEITDDEWAEIRNQTREYNSCLKQEMMQQVEVGNDARAVADKVLEICSTHLIELQQKMDADNIQPGFTERFIYNTKNKSSRQMLGGIMMLMAQKQARQENEATAEEAND